MDDIDKRSLVSRMALLGKEPQKIQFVKPKSLGKPAGRLQKKGSKASIVNSAQNGKENNSRLSFFSSYLNGALLTLFCSALLAGFFFLGQALRKGLSSVLVYKTPEPIYIDEILRMSDFTLPASEIVPLIVDERWFMLFEAITLGGIVVFGCIFLILTRKAILSKNR